VDAILEINILFKEDKYKEALVLVRLKSPKSNVAVTMEIMVNYKQNLHYSEHFQTPSSRIEEFSIGSEFDLKELVFRNFLNLLTTEHRPIARLKIKEGKSKVKLQVCWVSPYGRLAFISNLLINETTFSTVESLSLDIPGPLTPGVWRAIVVHDGSLYAEEKFLVVPSLLKYDSVQEMEEKENYKLITDAYIERYLENSPAPELIENDEDLYSAMGKYFNLVDSCGSLNCLKHCSETSWSSKFPDPKSQITGVDPVTNEIY